MNTSNTPVDQPKVMFTVEDSPTAQKELTEMAQSFLNERHQAFLDSLRQQNQGAINPTVGAILTEIVKAIYDTQDKIGMHRSAFVTTIFELESHDV